VCVCIFGTDLTENTVSIAAVAYQGTLFTVPLLSNDFCIAATFAFVAYQRFFIQLTKPSTRGYNWATLFLGDINTGTWPSRLGESQMRQ
jgi:hypothetical protein